MFVIKEKDKQRIRDGEFHAVLLCEKRFPRLVVIECYNHGIWKWSYGNIPFLDANEIIKHVEYWVNECDYEVHATKIINGIRKTEILELETK